MSKAGGPFLRGGVERAERVVLILHGGREDSADPTSALNSAYLRMLDFYAGLRQRSRSAAVYRLRFRVRGWNAALPVPDPVADARWALDELARRHPAAPVAILGHSMGGRTAFAVADDAAVVGVCALAPWLPDGEPLPARVDETAYVIAHGTGDHTTSSPQSLDYATRLDAAGARVARFELDGGRHALLDQPRLWHRFAVATTLGLVGDRPLPPGVDAALETARLSEPLAAFTSVGRS